MCMVTQPYVCAKSHTHAPCDATPSFLVKINLRKPVKLMVFFQINQKKKIMIISAMLLLRMAVAVKVALEVSVVLVVQIFQIFLRIFLVTLVEEADEVQEVETLTIEVQI